MALSLSLAGSIMEEVVIVGAGVSGLACMNALLDLGCTPHLFEAGTIGEEKICGEFLAQDAVTQLQKWDIGPIERVDAVTVGSLTIKLQGGAITRSLVEQQLKERALMLGGTIIENKAIESLEALRYKHIVVATGRFGTKPTSFPYIGLKGHFLHKEHSPTLHMHPFKGGYYGIVAVSPTVSNITCLVKKEYYAEAMAQINKDLDWLEGPIATFGRKRYPLLPNCYAIGDAFATIPPAAGKGFSFAISSALLAASHIFNNDQFSYYMNVEKILRPLLFRAKLLHCIMRSPTASSFTLQLLTSFPATRNFFLDS